MEIEKSENRADHSLSLIHSISTKALGIKKRQKHHLLEQRMDVSQYSSKVVGRKTKTL